jgi:hypothetical protein
MDQGAGEADFGLRRREGASAQTETKDGLVAKQRCFPSARFPSPTAFCQPRYPFSWILWMCRSRRRGAVSVTELGTEPGASPRLYRTLKIWDKFNSRFSCPANN